MPLELGSFAVTSLRAGYFRLDGGAMFGVVPKTLWQRHMPADEHNRIVMACNCLLARTPDSLVLVDTGYGDHLNPKEREIYGIEDETTITTALAQAGFAAQDITHVVLTHLHFDHATGVLSGSADDLHPTFPQATYLVQEGEWHDALQSRSTMKATYRPNELDILERSGQLQLIQGDTELGAGLTTFVTGGHTEHHQGVRIDTDDGTLVYPGDLVPMRTHLRLYWNMAYDMFPYQTLVRKREFLTQACDQQWIIAWDHDSAAPFSTVQSEGENYTANDVEI